MEKGMRLYLSILTGSVVFFIITVYMLGIVSLSPFHLKEGQPAIALEEISRASPPNSPLSQDMCQRVFSF